MDQKIISLLQAGKIGVLPTDTLYGLVGSALNKQAVERIYQVRKRTLNKPLIVLISSLEDLKLFSIQINEKVDQFLKKLWPAKVSVILPCLNPKFTYLHRGTQTLAFRLPDEKNLIDLLKRAGPLVAPSANWEGTPPAETIQQAQEYFKNGIDFYLDGGPLTSPPSTLIKIEDNKLSILRDGAIKIPSTLL